VDVHPTDDKDVERLEAALLFDKLGVVSPDAAGAPTCTWGCSTGKRTLQMR
jgi:hypothetical protein